MRYRQTLQNQPSTNVKETMNSDNSMKNPIAVMKNEAYGCYGKRQVEIELKKK